MGKKGGSPPAPPDPKETAAAQTGTNVSTAVANAFLNNVNQVTPDWALQYAPTGYYDWTDPSTGDTYQLPTFTAYQQLSPRQQALDDAGYSAELNLANLAADQSGRLNNMLGQPMTLDGLPERPGIPGRYDYSGFEGFEGLDPRYAEGGEITRGFGDAGSITRGFGDAGDVTRSYAPDDGFSSDRQRVEDALMARMEPYLERDREALRTQLSNQGIKLGSEAYDRGMEDYSRRVNDARFGAILNAGTEQQRMMDMAAQAAGFENAAQQQQYNQLYGRAGFANQAQAQQYGQLYDRAAFANQAQQQAYGQDRANIDSSNAAMQQMYDNYFRATGANNALQDARFAQDVSRYQMGQDTRNAALQEQFAIRNQPINEIAALLSGAQVQPPNFVNTNQYTIPTTDYAGIVGDNYRNRLSAWQTQQQQSGDMMGGLMGMAGSLGAAALLASDRRLKEDVEKVGETKSGFPLYLYRYKGEPEGERRLGVMAQDVEKKRPEAVVPMAGGYKAVDHRKALGRH